MWWRMSCAISSSGIMTPASSGCWAGSCRTGKGVSKLTKNRGSFPSDEALLKLFYLALRNISQKWTMPIRDWKAALTRFTIQFEERLPQL
jgi:hypothetical protein